MSVHSDVIPDATHDCEYSKGRFLGRGGFATVFELTETKSHRAFAGKIIPKSILKTAQHRHKMSQEIEIHRRLSHSGIVGFHSYFEDVDNVYIVLEICERRSMSELVKRRTTLTEPECRYFMHQICDAVDYLHKNRIIHRDLKLGNLLLSEDMRVKVGDFGLSTRLESVDQRRMSVCGTPNYIAPEILAKKGHGFEVDIWSIGCILYIMLLGKAPFATGSLKETYRRVMRNDFYLPPGIAANSLIRSMLSPDPSKRPTPRMITNSEFMVGGFCPKYLPSSCCSVAPKFKIEKRITAKQPPILAQIPPKPHLKDMFLHELLSGVDQMLSGQNGLLADHQPPNDQTFQSRVWVSRWVDDWDRHGFSYQLNDESIGVLFSDNSRITQSHPSSPVLEYVDKNGLEIRICQNTHDAEVMGKVAVLEYFKEYMGQNLRRTGENSRQLQENHPPPPYLLRWFRTRSALAMYLSNGVLQVNFFCDHVKYVLCPVMNSLTVISSLSGKVEVFRFDGVTINGFTKSISGHLAYVRCVISKLIEADKSGGMASKLALGQAGRPNGIE